MSKHFSAWESKNEICLRKLVTLIFEIKKVIQGVKGGKCALICKKNGTPRALHVYKRDAKPFFLPKDIKEWCWDQDNGKRRLNLVFILLVVIRVQLSILYKVFAFSALTTRLHNNNAQILEHLWGKLSKYSTGPCACTSRFAASFLVKYLGRRHDRHTLLLAPLAHESTLW